MPPPGKPDLSGYNYGTISSLVLTAERSMLPWTDKEPDGALESLVGRILDPKKWDREFRDKLLRILKRRKRRM